jgi:4-amino-4-deoxy-L-arabinose transferase-like glycosyltransferase
VGGLVVRVIDALDRWNRRILVGAMLFTIVVSGAYAVHFKERVRFFDEGDYLAIAQHLADGRGFSIYGSTPSAFRAPGFPLLLGVVRTVGVPITGARMLNVALLAVSVLLAWMLAGRIAGGAAAALAALGVALYPLQVFTASTFYPETLATTLLVAAVLCAVVADRAPAPRSTWLFGASGLLFSLLFLTVPSYGVTAILALVWLVWRRPTRLAAVAAFVVLLVLPVTAWTIRNAAELDAFVPATTGAGVNLLLGNNANTGMDTGVNADISRYTRTAKRRHLDEVALDRYYRSSAISYMKAHPARTLELWAEKTLNYFNAANRVATGSESSSGRNLIAAVTYYPLLILLFARLVLAVRRRLPLSRPEVLMVAIYLLLAPAIGVFFTRSRFRAPADALLIVLVAVGIVQYFLARRASSASAAHAPSAEDDVVVSGS